MSQLNLWLAVLGGLTLILGLSAGIMKGRSFLPTQPLVAVAIGITLGPYGLAILRITPIGDPLPVLEQIARFTIAFAVTSIALRLEPSYLRERARSLAVILGPGMVLMWLASALVAHLVLPVDVGIALLVGAVLTPTDPVLANAIVSGETATENIPKRLRYLISGEAGINDGAAYLFVFFPILLLQHPVETALGDWVARTLLWEVLGAILLGFVIGAAVGRLERWESAQAYLEETSVFTIVVGLTVFVLGLTKLAGTDGILAVFVAGVAYNWQADPQDEAKEQRIEEVIDRLFTIPVFVLFGMAVPWQGWIELGWHGVLLVGGVLLFRRLPMVFALHRFIPPLDRTEAVFFVGWFGPIGIAAAFYAILAMERTGSHLVWHAASLVIAGSLLVHGMTSTPLTHWYGGVNDSNQASV